MKIIRLLPFVACAALFSCKEYVPYVKCTVNGVPWEIKGMENVMASYTTMSGYTASTVIASGTGQAVTIHFQSNIPGTYTCTSTSENKINIEDNFTFYTTQESGGSGTIEVIQAGGNLIEGFFHGSVWANGQELPVTDGEFSGRTF